MPTPPEYNGPDAPEQHVRAIAYLAPDQLVVIEGPFGQSSERRGWQPKFGSGELLGR